MIITMPDESSFNFLDREPIYSRNNLSLQLFAERLRLAQLVNLQLQNAKIVIDRGYYCRNQVLAPHCLY